MGDEITEVPFAAPEPEDEQTQELQVGEETIGERPTQETGGQTEPAPVQETAPESGISSEVLEVAQGLGWSDDKIGAFANEDQLRGALLYELNANIGQAEKAQPAPQAEPKPTAEEKAVAAVLEALSGPEVDDTGEGFDPSLVKWTGSVTELVNAQAKRIEALETKLETAEKREAAAAAQQELRDFDAWISSKGETDAEVLGTGPTLKLAPKSEQLQARLELARAYVALQNGFSVNGNVPDRSKLFDMAWRMIRSEKPNGKQKSEKTGSRQTIARPSDRNVSYGGGTPDSSVIPGMSKGNPGFI